MSSHDRYWSDAIYREERRAYARNKMREMRAYARIARQDLRSFMNVDPRIAKRISSRIDIGSASDAAVVRFYKHLKWRLQHGDPEDRY